MILRPMSHDRRAQAGFSFIEILVVMGILAVLVGMGIGIYVIAFRRSAEFKTTAVLRKTRGSIDQFRSRYGCYPPSDFSRLPLALGIGVKIGRTTPPNATNLGIESAYLAFVAPGVRVDADLDADKSNTDHDALDASFDPHGDVNLYEVKDDAGNPLVFMAESDYATFEKTPPTYVDKDGREFHPKPWRNPEGTAFAQANGYQLYSIGPDGIPNTEDDLKTWE